MTVIVLTNNRITIPDAFDNKLMEDCLIGIINGRVTNIPVYDFKLNSRVVNKYITVYPNQVDVVLFEGILTGR